MHLGFQILTCYDVVHDGTESDRSYGRAYPGSRRHAGV
jgi:hypothetical protein